jgi:hypothetical protein
MSNDITTSAMERKDSGLDEKDAQPQHHPQQRDQILPVVDFDDPNIDRDAALLEEDSPYPEVRSAVANTGALVDT